MQNVIVISVIKFEHVFEITPTDANKTNCECSELGSVAVVSELSERFLIPQATECKSSKIIKYIGIAVSVVACLIFILGEFILFMNTS